MDTFGERLHAAATASGYTETYRLAANACVECDLHKRWMDRREAPESGQCVARIAWQMRVRTYWLLTGEGVVHANRIMPPHERIVVEIASHLDERALRTWIAIGQRLALP